MTGVALIVKYQLFGFYKSFVVLEVYCRESHSMTISQVLGRVIDLGERNIAIYVLVKIYDVYVCRKC